MNNKTELGEITFSEIVIAKLLTLLEEIRNGIKSLVDKADEETYDGVLETYEVTATTNPKTLWPPLDKDRKRPKWLWVQIVNDSSTTSAYAGINVGNVNALTIGPGESQRVQFGNKRKIEFVNYKTAEGTAALRIICAR